MKLTTARYKRVRKVPETALLFHFMLLALSLFCGAEHAAERYEQSTAIAYATPVHLSGRRAGAIFEARIGQGSLWLSRTDGPLRAIWLDRDGSSWHQHWNGFVGRASPGRGFLRSLSVAALDGTLSARKPSKVRCRHRRGKTYAALFYDGPRGARTEVDLDPVSSLPRNIEVSDDVFVVRLQDLRYDLSSEIPFLTHMAAGDELFFDRASFDDPMVAAVPRTRVQPLERTIRVPLIRSVENPNSRGLVATIGGHRLRLLVDSGDTVTVLSPQAAKVVARPSTSLSRYMVTASGVFQFPMITVPDIRIGSFHLRRETAIISSDTHGYDGMIGLSLFSLGKITLTKSTLLISPSHRRNIALEKSIDTYDGFPVARARLGKRNIALLLDTGAAVDAIIPGRWAQLGESVPLDGVSCKIQGWISFGQEVVARGYAAFDMGGTPMQLDACVTSRDENFPGMTYGFLGYKAISQTIRAFDYQAKRIELLTKRRL